MKISVVIPVYNVRNYLARCMESLAAQTYSDMEIILVDDGSDDGSGAVCDGYVKRQGVQVIHQENGGLGMARNRGLDAACGEYVLFLDPDDYYDPRLVQNLCGAAEHYDADLVIGGLTTVGRDGKKQSCAISYEQVFRSQERMKELLFHTVGSPPEERLDSKYGVSACGRLYRLEVIRRGRIRFLSERQMISEDLIFNIDFLQHAKSAVVTADAFYFYCTNAGSLSKRHREDRFEKDIALWMAVEERLAGYPEKECRLCLQRLLISRARYDIIQEADYYDLVNPSYPFKKKVSEIVHAPLLCEVLKDYPWWKLPRMQAIFAWFMKQQKVWSMLVLIRLRRRFFL